MRRIEEAEFCAGSRGQPVRAYDERVSMQHRWSCTQRRCGVHVCKELMN